MMDADEAIKSLARQVQAIGTTPDSFPVNPASAARLIDAGLAHIEGDRLVLHAWADGKAVIE